MRNKLLIVFIIFTITPSQFLYSQEAPIVENNLRKIVIKVLSDLQKDTISSKSPYLDKSYSQKEISQFRQTLLTVPGFFPGTYINGKMFSDNWEISQVELKNQNDAAKVFVSGGVISSDKKYLTNKALFFKVINDQWKLVIDNDKNSFVKE